MFKRLIAHIIPKSFSRKPVFKTDTYDKYGLIRILHHSCCCPRCGSVINAGPKYRPNYCEYCGQKINFSDIAWKEDKEIGYIGGIDNESF